MEPFDCPRCKLTPRLGGAACVALKSPNPRPCELVELGRTDYEEYLLRASTGRDTAGIVALEMDHKEPARAAAMPAARGQAGPCVWVGDQAVDDDGSPLMVGCETCRGTVRLKVFECFHPGHAASPTTTARACRACGDYEAEGEPVPVGAAGGDAVLNYWRGGGDDLRDAR